MSEGKEMKEVQNVELAVQICGDYCAWHEVSFSILYDFTNDIAIDDDYTKEDVLEMIESSDVDYCDADIVFGVKIGDDYYLDI